MPIELRSDPQTIVVDPASKVIKVATIVNVVDMNPNPITINIQCVTQTIVVNPSK